MSQWKALKGRSTLTVSAYAEKFGNAREDTEVLVEEPANTAKKPLTPEAQTLRPQLKPLRPLDYMGKQAPKAAFKPSEKPLFELPVLGYSGLPRLPSDLMLLDSATVETRSQPPLLPAVNVHKDDLDSLLRDVEAA